MSKSADWSKNPHLRPHTLSSTGQSPPTSSPTLSPSVLLPPPHCNAGPTSLASASEMWNIYLSVKQDFMNTISGLTPNDLTTIIGMSVRLPFHDAGEIFYTNKTDTFGPDGCLSNDPDSNGLFQLNQLPSTLLEPIWQTYCTQIGRGNYAIDNLTLSLSFW